MAYVASLNTSPNFTFGFAVFETDSGFPVDRQSYVTEPLTAMGVDGVRVRLPRREWREFTASTIVDCTTWAQAQRVAANYRDSVGKIATLSITTAGGTFQWKGMYIMDCTPQQSAGKVVGGGVGAANTCHVRAVWTLRASSNAQMQG